MRTAITGATGFVGSALVTAFKERGWHVIALGRADIGSSAAPSPIEFRHFDLADGGNVTLDGADVLVHCALEPYTKVMPESSNVMGSKALFEAARAQGVKRLVFVSSTASRENTSSQYGREKYAVEQLLDPTRDLIVRPGLVIGDGGLGRSIYNSVRKLRIAPLFFGGRKPVYTIAITDLARAIADLIERGASGVHVLSAPPITMRELYEHLASKANVRVRFIPLPYTPVLVALQIAERVHVKLPLTSGSMKGVASMEYIDPDTLQDVGLQIRPFCEVIDSLEFSSS